MYTYPQKLCDLVLGPELRGKVERGVAEQVPLVDHPLQLGPHTRALQQHGQALPVTLVTTLNTVRVNNTIEAKQLTLDSI